MNVPEPQAVQCSLCRGPMKHVGSITNAKTVAVHVCPRCDRKALR